MQASQYFERTLFYDRNPDVDEYYESCADNIFEKDVSKVQIEVRLQSRSDAARCRTAARGNLFGNQKHHKDTRDGEKPEIGVWPNGSTTPEPDRMWTAGKDYPMTSETQEDPNSERREPVEVDDDCSVFSDASSTVLPSAIDQLQGECGPPLYPGLPRLIVDELAPDDIERFIKATKTDFRVFYLRQRHSHSRLQITKEVFERLLKACHVFPRFNEYVIGFGSKSSETEVGPPPLKYRCICTTIRNMWRGFECSYILRYVEKTNRPGGRKPWSLRQLAIYHRFKPALASRCSTWILVGASRRTELRLDRYTRGVGDVFQANPFELHIIFLDTTIANWRPYLVHLTRLVQEQSGRSSGYTISGEDDAENFVTIEVEDHQQLKQIEDDVADLLLCLDSTMDTLTTFLRMYKDFLQQQDKHVGSSQHPDVVAVAFETKAKEISYTRKRAENLLSRVQNTRTLVSSLLERQSGHNIDQQIEALQKLEKQGQDENAIMRQLAEKNSRDSSSMKILTVITMVYLPCTIVSNFYSTQFVSQVESDTGITTLQYTQNAWLFFAISIPLTVFTIFTWFLWMNLGSILRAKGISNKNNMQGSWQLTQFFGTRRPLDKLPQ